MNEPSRKKILIVYQDEGVRAGLDLILSVQHDTIKTNHPDQAADILGHDASIGLIMWETAQLAGHGSTALAGIREKHPALKTLLIAGKRSPDTVSLASRPNADGYVAKPFMPEKVLSIIQQNIG